MDDQLRDFTNASIEFSAPTQSPIDDNSTNISHNDPSYRFNEQKVLIIGIQVSLLFVFGTKYFFPDRFKSTHSKILAFFYVLSTLNEYK